MSGELPLHQKALPDNMEMYDNFKWPEEVPRLAWDQLTLAQKQLVMEAYRFGGYRTGSYQALSFNGNGMMLP